MKIGKGIASIICSSNRNRQRSWLSCQSIYLKFSWPLIVTVIFYTVISTLLIHYFPANYDASSFFQLIRFTDFLLQLFLGYILFFLTQNLILYLLSHFVVFSTIYIGSIIKIKLLREPISIEDIASVDEVFKIFWHTHYSTTLLACSIVFISLVVLSVYHVKKTAIFSFLSCFIVVITLVLLPDYWAKFVFSSRASYQPWSRVGNFHNQGGTISLLGQVIKHASISISIPSQKEVKNALHILKEYSKKSHQYQDKVGDVPSTRNVYIFMLESFWDPGKLADVQLSEAAFSPEFIALWKQGGGSQVASPSLGGVTCQVEFELLTGYPSTLNNERYLFDKKIKNSIPALPRILSEQGYKTYAAHPNGESFWNRNNVYPKLGFEKFYSIKDFVKDDMNGAWLSDESLYQQTFSKITENQSDRPIFAFVLTGTGHYPFYINEEKRPSHISVTPHDAELSTHVNSIYHSSREIVEFVNDLRESDPDSIIVVLGDHAAGYAARLLSETSSGEKVLQAFLTPLIVINGKAGPVSLGIVNTYNIPSIVLNMMGRKSNHILNDFSADGMRVRSFYDGKSLVIQDDFNIVSCLHNEDNAICKRVSQWEQSAARVIEDIIYGHQFYKMM